MLKEKEREDYMNIDLFSMLNTSFVLFFPHGSMWKLWDFRTLVFYVIQLPVLFALADHAVQQEHICRVKRLVFKT